MLFLLTKVLGFLMTLLSIRLWVGEHFLLAVGVFMAAAVMTSIEKIRQDYLLARGEII